MRLTKKQEKAISLLANSTLSKKFYWTGGTLLAYYNHEKKTLKKRNKLLGVYVDSLEDIAANKTMVYFDRNEPKDLFDMYFLIYKGGFTQSQLLELVHKKFGVSFSESLFWSESFKSLPLLRELKPLILERQAKEQDGLLDRIEKYFKDGSYKFLRKTIR